MSKQALTAILNQMQIWLNETEKEQLHRELLAYFGLVGATNQCQAFDSPIHFKKVAIAFFYRALVCGTVSKQP